MHENDIPLFLSTEDPVVPSKRQKTTTNSPLTSEFSPLKSLNPTEKLIELRTKLRQAKATRARFHKMIIKVGEDLEEEEKNLEREVQAEIDSIKPLQVHPIESVQSHSQLLQQSQKYSPLDVSQMKIETKERIMNLLTQAARMISPRFEDISTSPTSQDEDEEDQRHLRGMQENEELAEPLEEDDGLTFTPIDLYDTELEAVKRKIHEFNSARACQEEKQTLLSRAARANELEEELQSAKKIISSLSAALKGKLLLTEEISSTQMTLDADKVEILQKISKESPGDREFGTRKNGSPSTALETKQSMKDLDLCLMKARELTLKFPESNTEMSQENAEIRRINSKIMTENFQLKERMADMERQMMKLKEDLNSLRGSPSRPRVGVKGLEPQVALLRIKRDKFTLKAAEKVELAALKGNSHRYIEKSGGVKVRGIGRKARKSSADQHDFGSDSNGEVDTNDKIRSVIKTKRGRYGLRVKFGGNVVLVSDSRYFDIVWTEQCQLIGGTYRCNDCPTNYKSMNDMKDHIWSEHFGGKFQCAYCKGSPKFYKWQKNAIQHIHAEHLNKCHCRKCCS